MNRAVVSCVTILLLGVIIPDSSRAADRELLLGTIYKDNAFAVPKLSSKKPRLAPQVVLMQGSLAVKPAAPYTPKRYQFPQFVTDNHPYRWRIVHEIFWGSGTAGVRIYGLDVKRIPMADLSLVDPSNPKRKEQYLTKFPEDRSYKQRDYDEAFTWEASMVSDVCYSRPLGPGDVFQPPFGKPPIPTPGIFFDVYPIADERLLLFISDGEAIAVWSGTTKRGALHYWDMDWGKNEKAIEAFRSPLKEAFMVFVRDKDYYFVTESGSVYLARSAGEGQERKMEQIWDGKDKPIHALITDASDDKVYCFVEPARKDKQEEDRVYFEISAKPETTKYNLKRIEGVQIDEPLKSVLEYAHVLQQDKKIK